MSLEVVALVSIGCHPASGRPRRAPMDARAVELGLGLVGTRLRLVHAGDPDHPALREYLGMGVPELDVLALPAAADIVPAMVQHLRNFRPSIVLTGLCCEGGEDSGMVPYLTAVALGMTVVPGVVDIAADGAKARVLQALPRGRRRCLSVPLPFIATVGQAAAAPRQSAFGPARRGRILKLDAGVPIEETLPAGQRQPARPRPKRLQAASSGNAAERLRAASGAADGKGRLLTGLDPATAAQAIFTFLVEQDVIKPHPNSHHVE